MPIQGSRGKVISFSDFTQMGYTGVVADATTTTIDGVSLMSISGDTTVTHVAGESGGVFNFNSAGAAGDGVSVAGAGGPAATCGPLFVEARWQSSVVTDCRLFVGFQETYAVGEPLVPFTLATTTLTVNATGEAVGFYFDGEATTDDFRFMAGSNSAASTTAALDYALGGQTTLGALGVRANATVTANRWTLFRVEVEPDGAVTGWIGDETMNSNNLIKIATLRAGDITTTANLTPVVTMTCHSTGDPQHKLDYFLSSMNRDWSAS